MALSGLSATLKGYLESGIARTFLRTFVARGVAAVGTLLLSVIIGQIHGPEGVGVFALALSILLGSALLAKSGMDNALMRYAGQDISSPYIARYSWWALSRVMGLSVPTAIVLFVCRDLIAQAFKTPGLSDMMVGFSLAMPAYTLSFVLSGFFKGVRKPATACLLENGAVACVAGVAIVIWHWPDGLRGLRAIGFLYACAAWFVAIFGASLWLSWLRSQPWWSVRHREGRDSNHEAVTFLQFRSTSRAFFVINIATFMQQVLAVMIAGLLLTSGQLGLFKSSQQAAGLISFVLVVINAIFPPRFAALYYRGERDALGKLVRQGALLGVMFAAPFFIVCQMFPDWVLGLFGDEFAEAEQLLRLIAFAQLVSVASGSVALLLNMTGHERLMRNVGLLCNAFGLIAFATLIPFFDVFGAALALSVVIMTQNLVAMFFVWRRLGIWTLPGPNLLKLVGVRSQPPR